MKSELGVHDNTIIKSDIDILTLIIRGYYDELVKDSMSDVVKKMTPILEFSNKDFFKFIIGVDYNSDELKEAKEEIINKKINYWYRQGKLRQNEVRIFFLEKPFNDMYINVLI